MVNNLKRKNLEKRAQEREDGASKMKFNPPLVKATFLKRYRRFLVDIETDNGEAITIHCPNTGSIFMGDNCTAGNKPVHAPAVTMTFPALNTECPTRTPIA